MHVWLVQMLLLKCFLFMIISESRWWSHRLCPQKKTTRFRSPPFEESQDPGTFLDSLKLKEKIRVIFLDVWMNMNATESAEWDAKGYEGEEKEWNGNGNGNAKVAPKWDAVSKRNRSHTAKHGAWRVESEVFVWLWKETTTFLSRTQRRPRCCHRQRPRGTFYFYFYIYLYIIFLFSHSHPNHK